MIGRVAANVCFGSIAERLLLIDDQRKTGGLPVTPKLTSMRVSGPIQSPIYTGTADFQLLRYIARASAGIV